MEFKHSPAPWVADIRSGCCAVYQKNRSNDTAGCHRDDDRNIVYSSKGARYDEKLCHWVMDEETQANFTLIAAAPELLDALIELTESAKEAIDGLGDLSDAIDTAKAAIAKALGQQ
ncbi:hypothetical protein [Providencia rettgeri]|uniref:hypothetical protein n=1 Tax=Providencia rettgeri TaxID=587 RepID=UPI0025524C25|nr:hypothetical protein [Providencia rettgeri]